MCSIEQQYQNEIDDLKLQNHKLAVALKEIIAVTAAYHNYDNTGRIWLSDARALLEEADIIDVTLEAKWPRRLPEAPTCCDRIINRGHSKWHCFQCGYEVLATGESDSERG